MSLKNIIEKLEQEIQSGRLTPEQELLVRDTIKQLKNTSQVDINTILEALVHIITILKLLPPGG